MRIALFKSLILLITLYCRTVSAVFLKKTSAPGNESRGGAPAEGRDSVPERCLATDHHCVHGSIHVNSIMCWKGEIACNGGRGTLNLDEEGKRGAVWASADKKRPPFSAGAKLPWFSRVARAWLAA